MYNVRPVEHDLDYLSKHGADDFYSDVRPFEVKHDFDFCKLGGAETVNYDLERLTMISSARHHTADKHCSVNVFWYCLINVTEKV